MSCFIFSTFEISSSTEPNSFINCDAIFGPIPGTPGTLSDESPAKAWTSTTFSGLTPNFSKTVSFVICFFFIGSIIETLFFNNCIKSLSPEIIVTFLFASMAARAYDAIKSSASNPLSSIDGILKASGTFFIKSNCGFKSSGGSPRLALYWG